MQAGWPREALLITVVRDKKGDGHAVLTVKTDHGEFILDNQEPQILPWNKTGYRFVKRQSQSDPNVWVLARRTAHGSRDSLGALTGKGIRVPGHVPTPPRPQTGFASGRLSPKGRPHIFQEPRAFRFPRDGHEAVRLAAFFSAHSVSHWATASMRVPSCNSELT